MSLFKKFVVLFFILFTVKLHAQDFPYHYFSHISPMAANPSLAAIDGGIKADITTFNLWAGGFKPVNYNVVSFSMMPGFNKMEKQTRKQPWVGVGASLLKEKSGPFNQYIFQAIYAYHIPLGSSQLSFGVSGLIENINIDVNSLTPSQPGDPRLESGNNRSFLIDAGFGTTFRGKGFQISFSALNLMPGAFQFDDIPAENISSYRKLFLTGDYEFQLLDKFSFQPAFTLRNSIQNEINYDASLKFDLHYISIGIGYRSENSIYIYTQIPFRDFVFTYSSENPMQSNHMIGKEHTFSVCWSMKKLKFK